MAVNSVKNEIDIMIGNVEFVAYDLRCFDIVDCNGWLDIANAFEDGVFNENTTSTYRIDWTGGKPHPITTL